MDVRCERCRAQYVFDDDQVTAVGLTVQCTNCGHLFRVKKKELVVIVPVKASDVEGTPIPATAAAPRPAGRVSSPGMPAAAAAAAPSAEPERAREWRVRQANGNIFTFRELTTLQKWIIEQKVGRDDEISLVGDQWKRLGNIAELASFFQVVEAAERSRTQAQPAITPLPGVGPLPMPVYGVAVQTPSLYQPTPSGSFPLPPTPSGSFPLPPGYPPPAGSYPPPPSGFPPPAFATPPPPAPVRASAPAPVHEVDLGIEEPPRRSGGSGARTWLLVGLALAAVGGGAYVMVPLLFPKPPPPPPKVEPAPVVEAKPAPLPEPPPAPVPAPEPVVEPAPPPEPIASPTKVAPPQPKGPKALLARAKVLLEKGNAVAALELYGRVASEDPENVEAQTGRGLCYLDLENGAPAEASFQAALQLEPDYADALLGLAETYRFRGKKAEAIATYERYLARYPGGEEAEVAKNALSELRK